MNMETGYELNVPVGDGNKDVKAIISNNEVIWERAIPTPKSGVAPLSFRATRAKPLLDWEITGKTYQAWTPSPEPQIGNNKLDNSKIEKSVTVTNFAYTDSSVSFGSMTVGSTINSAEIKSEDTSYAFSFTGDINKVTFALRCYNSSHTYLGDANKIFDEASRAVMTTLANTAYVRLYITTTVQGNISLTNLMLNKGNTVMAFEPFGYLPNTGACPVQGVGDYDAETGKYKISVVSGGMTTPIYLDTPLMADEILKSDGTREVKWKKVVFTGNELIVYELGYNRFYIRNADINVPSKRVPVYCNKFDGTNVDTTRDNLCFVYVDRFHIYYDAFGTDVTTLKMWLQQEYTNGTPLTIYYPLTEPTSETVDVPQISTFKGTNTLSIDTEVQPSNLSITYLSSGFEPQPLKTADGQILYTNDNQPLNTLE